jgi:hypothetical protein
MEILEVGRARGGDPATRACTRANQFLKVVDPE